MIDDRSIDLNILESKLDTIIEGIREIKKISNNDIEVETGNLTEKAKTQTFARFDFDVFNPVPDNDSNISQRENMFNIFSFIDDYADKGILGNLLFYGYTGTGKTYLANCIANDFESKGMNVKCYTSTDLMQVISNSIIHRENVKGYNDIRNCDLLIIDNLGAEMITDFVASQLLNLIEYRENRLLRTIITTNLKLKKIGELYTQRVLSRILGEYRIFRFIGNDIRFGYKK